MVEIFFISLFCLVFSNIRTYRLGRLRGIEDALTTLKANGLIDYEEE